MGHKKTIRGLILRFGSPKGVWNSPSPYTAVLLVSPPFDVHGGLGQFASIGVDVPTLSATFVFQIIPLAPVVSDPMMVSERIVLRININGRIWVFVNHTASAFTGVIHVIFHIVPVPPDDTAVSVLPNTPVFHTIKL